MPMCFVIQPFDDENDKRYDEVFAPALNEAGVEPYRVDRDPAVDVPIEAIEDRIRNADICLADITTDNPNVWYELGFAYAAGGPVVMICAKSRSERLPFDIRHRVVIKYGTATPSDFKQLHRDIVERVTARLAADSARGRSIENNNLEVGQLLLVSSDDLSKSLSREAKEILRTAAVGDGKIKYRRGLGSPGVSIQVGERSFIPQNVRPRDVASWVAGMEELEANDFVRATGDARNLFEVTRKGYDVADSLER